MAKTIKNFQQDVDDARTKHKHDGGHKRNIDGVIKKMFANLDEKLDKKFADLWERIKAIETDVQQLKGTVDHDNSSLIDDAEDGNDYYTDEDGGAGDHVEGQPADITQYIDGVIKRMFANHVEKLVKKFADLWKSIKAIETDVQQLKGTDDHDNSFLNDDAEDGEDYSTDEDGDDYSIVDDGDI